MLLTRNKVFPIELHSLAKVWFRLRRKLTLLPNIRSAIRSKEKSTEILVHTFCAPNNMFVDTIAHVIFCAPQIAVRAHVCAYVHLDLHLLQRQNVVEQKVKFRSIPLGINPEPILGTILFFIEKETIERSVDSLEPNNRQLSVNCVWKQWTSSVIPTVCWFKKDSETASDYFNQGIKTM